MWVRFSLTDGDYDPAGTGISDGWLFHVANSPGFDYLYFYIEGSSLRVDWTYAAHTWYHIAATRESGTVRLFVDGTLLGSKSDATPATNSSPLQIGKDVIVSNFFDGNIDEIRISNGIARYTSNFTPSGPFTPSV
jgi:hypothetical protein